MNRPSRGRRGMAQRHWTWTALAGGLLAAGLGCSQNSALVRGQSDDGMTGVARTAGFAPRPARAAGGPIYRAQSPDRGGKNIKLVTHEGVAVSPDQAPGFDAAGGAPTYTGPIYGDGQYAPPGGQYGQPCPPEGYGGGYCPPGQPCPPGYGHACPHGYGHGCPHGCPCLDNCPMLYPGFGDRHAYSVKDIGTPVYPAGTGPALTGPGTPGAIVQYPYYTTKGPDDFFLDQDGRY